MPRGGGLCDGRCPTLIAAVDARWHVPPAASCAPPPLTRTPAAARGTEDWFARVENYLRAAFPSATWRMRNGCVAATMSEYTSMCLDHFVDEDVDLMFIEYTVNGATPWPSRGKASPLG